VKSKRFTRSRSTIACKCGKSPPGKEQITARKREANHRQDKRFILTTLSLKSRRGTIFHKNNFYQLKDVYNANNRIGVKEAYLARVVSPQPVDHRMQL